MSSDEMTCCLKHLRNLDIDLSTCCWQCWGVLEHHYRSAADVAPISHLISLGETEMANQLEGLTNQAAAIVVAEDIGNTQYEQWLRQPLSEEQVILYLLRSTLVKSQLTNARNSNKTFDRHSYYIILHGTGTL